MTHSMKLAGALLLACFVTLTAQAGAHKSGADGDSGDRHGRHFGGRHFGGPRGGMDMMPGFGKEIDLSDEQKEEMAALMGIYGPRLKELRERGDAKRKELMALAPDDPAYDDLTEDVSEDVGKAAAELVVLLAEMQANAYGILTDEQQAKYLELRASSKERMQERRDAWRERREQYRGKRGKHKHGDHDHSKHDHGDEDDG
ncbi:MAG: Spy/CpxP family protein refolding chaperone [Gammaproteobacteria bacterium]|nr:Spy/CpxP family protein refolding chaperone [Gammaproteobacteria bacterium]MDP6616548.1 Spy/CpxP family protein refolding chaperone [Gammaproteobacteria bacterium]MDP6694203.1 Spy/CpxP family protein refolding chaperone [Gammaproteobacteria bacterium]